MTDHEKQIEEFGQNDDFWLFGYGSLIWKPPPHYDQRIPGYIEGYVRRFWQASEDHRGTPEAPGRVVTLIDRAHWETLTDHHASTERVWGAAYHIPAAKVREVREYLDLREINGYSIQFTAFHPIPFTTTTVIASPPAPSSPSAPTDPFSIVSTTEITTSSDDIAATSRFSAAEPHAITTLVYIGLPSNPQFLGPQDPDALARHILNSKGPSGENREYLYQLERALKELGRESGDAHVSDLARRCRALEAAGEKGGEEEGRMDGVHKEGGTEELEEVEKGV